MKLFRSYMGSAVASVLWGIPLAFLLAGGYHFFVGVIVRREVLPFLSSVRVAYIGVVVVLLVWDVTSYLRARRFVRVLASKWEVDQDDVVEAIVDFKLHRELGFRQWDGETFSVNLAAARLARGIADVLFD